MHSNHVVMKVSPIDTLMGTHEALSLLAIRPAGGPRRLSPYWFDYDRRRDVFRNWLRCFPCKNRSEHRALAG
jgi:hypothetical protein